jgi:thiamine-phosphate pyrophosphorylase
VKPLNECLLYTFVDSAYLHGRDPVQLTADLCQGGADLVQLRAKDWPMPKIAEIGRQMIEVTRKYSTRLVINDYLGVAQELGAEICHLGQEDFFDAGHSHVSKLCGPDKTVDIGLSTHSPDQALRALAAAPAYIAIGPVFATGTKPSARPVTLEYVRWAADNVRIPWFAIGGITLANLSSVIAAGAKRICVVSAILNQTDVTGACRLFRKTLESVPP